MCNESLTFSENVNSFTKWNSTNINVYVLSGTDKVLARIYGHVYPAKEKEDGTTETGYFLSRRK